MTRLENFVIWLRVKWWFLIGGPPRKYQPMIDHLRTLTEEQLKHVMETGRLP